MKVVLFCGGFGTRLREHSEVIPKPLVDVGNRPIIWHLMKYYAHFGHKEFILCLGYKGELIKQFFLDYNSYLYRDFRMEQGGADLTPPDSDIADWSIQFVDTGLHSNIGQRLLRVRKLLDGEQMFLANYSDGLSNIDLNAQLDAFKNSDALACFSCVRPSYSLSSVNVDTDGNVNSIEYLNNSDVWINGGFMVLDRSFVSNYLTEDETLTLEEEPMRRAAADQQMSAYVHHGFWQCVDNPREYQLLNTLWGSGRAPWKDSWK